MNGISLKIFKFAKRAFYKFTATVPDGLFLQFLYFRRLHKFINFKNPKTFNEKLQWLKIYNRRSEYTVMADKLLMKEYVRAKVGTEVMGGGTIQTIGVWNRFEEIDFDTLPESFVLKCTHDSGSVCICKNKKEFNKKAARDKLSDALKMNYYLPGREWVYKNIEPKIIAEPYMTDESGTELKDYKFHCFAGRVEYVQVDFGRFTKHGRNVYDRDWNFVDVVMQYPNDINHIIRKPAQLEEMISMAEKLSAEIPYLRVDFYIINAKIYVGEMTFYHECGTEKVSPPEFDYKLGDLIRIEGSK